MMQDTFVGPKEESFISTLLARIETPGTVMDVRGQEWLKLDTWTPDQALLLGIGLDPNETAVDITRGAGVIGTHGIVNEWLKLETRTSDQEVVLGIALDPSGMTTIEIQRGTSLVNDCGISHLCSIDGLVWRRRNEGWFFRDRTSNLTLVVAHSTILADKIENARRKLEADYVRLRNRWERRFGEPIVRRDDFLTWLAANDFTVPWLQWAIDNKLIPQTKDLLAPTESEATTTAAASQAENVPATPAPLGQGTTQNALPTGVCAAEIIEKFKLDDKWRGRLSHVDRYTYLKKDGVLMQQGCRKSATSRGMPNLFNPVKFAEMLMEREKKTEQHMTRIIENRFGLWLDIWYAARAIDAPADWEE
jgi:uncharacterized protein (DUF2132 family)